jgi:hypothetical protein
MFRRSLTAQPALRTVCCYHCRRAIEVAAAAQTLSCPCCYQRLRVDDILVDGAVGFRELRTAGAITVAKRGWLRASRIEAGQGLTVLGRLTGSASSHRVVIGPNAVWEGDCTALAIDLHPTATVVGGVFRVGATLPS